MYRLGVGGSAANPPHLGHMQLLYGLLTSGWFEEIHWNVCGARTDKEVIDPDHRVAMTMLAFPLEWLWLNKTKLIVRFRDVYQENPPTIDLLHAYKKDYPHAEIIWFTGADSVVPQEKFGGKCEVEAVWEGGEELMSRWPFCVVSRPGFPHPSTFPLPPQFRILDIEMENISSSQVRTCIAERKPFEHLVTSSVAAYIKKHHLYGW